MKICLTFFGLWIMHLSLYGQSKSVVSIQPILGHRSVALISQDGFTFKDLNKNGTLDLYEDWRLSHAVRAKDLITKMSISDKVGFMLISTARLKMMGPLEHQPTGIRSPVILMKKIRSKV